MLCQIAHMVGELAHLVFIWGGVGTWSSFDGLLCWAAPGFGSDVSGDRIAVLGALS